MSAPLEVAVPPPLSGERVDRVVSFITGLPRAEAAAIIDAGGVRLGGKQVRARSRRVREGDTLEIAMPDPRPPLAGDPTVSFAAVHADDAVIVIDKPAGLVVHPGAGNPGGTLVHGLLARFPDMGERSWPDPARPGIVHRLDKGTSGLLMIARRPDVMASLSAQLEARSVERRYLALVWGAVENANGVIDAPLGRSLADPTRIVVRADGRRAVTRYEVVSRGSDPQATTLLRCSLETGRTHQIRVHLAAIGHPVVGDDRYRVGRPGAAVSSGERGRGDRRGTVVAPGLALARPFLHAQALAFDHPGSGGRLRFESELPSDLAAVLTSVR